MSGDFEQVPGRLDARWCYCLPSDPERDLHLLHQLLVAPDTGWRVRYRGTPPTLDQVRRDLFTEDVVAQWTVFGIRNNEFRGWVHIGSANLVDGVAHLSLASTEESRGWGTFLEAAACCIDECFLGYPLRKLYGEVLSDNLSEFLAGGVGKYFTVEGVRRQCRYVRGGYRDVTLLAIDRLQWAEARTRRLQV